MADSILEAYLVKLGATVDSGSFTKFDSQLLRSQRNVTGTVTSIVKDFAKLEFGIVSTFAAVGLGILSMADKTAMADQNYRLLGMRMLLSKDQARSFQMSLDALGVTVDDLVDPEINARFQSMMDRFQSLGKTLGPGFDKNMKDIRLLRDEYKMFEAEVQFLGMGAVSKLFEKLGFGSGDLLTDIRKLNDEIVTDLPAWADKAGDVLLPIWKDVVTVMGGVKISTEDVLLGFTNIVGVLSGDDSIQGSTFKIENLGKALDHVANAMTTVSSIASKTISATASTASTGASLLGALGHKAAAKWYRDGAKGAEEAGNHGLAAQRRQKAEEEQAKADGQWNKYMELRSQHSPFITHVNPPTQQYTDFMKGSGFHPVYDPSKIQIPAALTEGMNSPSAPMNIGIMKALAMDVSQKTGIPAELIFEQWSHETGGFTSNVFTKFNNAAGMEKGVDANGKPIYRQYATPQDFETDYLKTITSKRYTSQGILNAKTPEDFAGSLKRGGYYEDSYENYAAGMRNAQGLAVSVGIVNINLPPGTPDEHAEQIVGKLREVGKNDVRRTMAQTAGGPY